MNSPGRIPPYSLEAEHAVIGAILLDNSALARVAAIVAPEHFYVEANRVIHQAMVDVIQSGSVIDHVTLGARLTEAGELERVGGVMALSKLTDGLVTTAHVDHHARIVRSLSAVRKMIYAAQEVVANGFAHHEDPEEYLASSRRIVTEAASDLNIGAGPQRLDGDFRKLCEELEKKEMPKGIVGTGVSRIDGLTGGLWPAQLTVIAGRTGMGKSCVGLNFSTNASLRGNIVAHFSLEDRRHFITRRMLARIADIDFAKLVINNVADADWPKIIDGLNRIGTGLPLLVDDRAGLTASEIVRHCYSMKQSIGLDLVVVDYIQKVKKESSLKTDDPKLIISASAAILDNMACNLKIPVVVLSQLNREVERRQDKRPVLADLKFCGDLEDMARAVHLLLRPGYYSGEETRCDLQYWIAKMNQNKTGLIKLYMDLSRMWVRDWNTMKDGEFPDGESNVNGGTNRQQKQQHLPMGGRCEY